MAIGPNQKLGNKKTRNNYFIKKETPTKVFPVNFVKFSRTPFLQNTSRRILLFLIYLTVSFCKEVLYICSNLLLLEKATKTHNFGIFSFCKYILYSILWMHFNYRSKHKHKKSCFVNARILESFYKKGKKLRKKMKKWQIEKSEVSEISEKLFRVFLFSSFRFCPTAKIENSDLKILEKNFRDFRVFDLALVYTWTGFCIAILIIYMNMSA